MGYVKDMLCKQTYDSIAHLLESLAFAGKWDMVEKYLDHCCECCLVTYDSGDDTYLSADFDLFFYDGVRVSIHTADQEICAYIDGRAIHFQYLSPCIVEKLDEYACRRWMATRKEAPCGDPFWEDEGIITVVLDEV